MNDNNNTPKGWGKSNSGDAKASPWENKSKTSAWGNSPSDSAWKNTSANSGNRSSKSNGVDSADISAAVNKFANIAKKAGEKAAGAAKNAVDYAKSDEAAEKLNSLKDKAGSAVSGVGSKLSGIKNKASDKISEHRNNEADSNDNSSEQNIENTYESEAFIDEVSESEEELESATVALVDNYEAYPDTAENAQDVNVPKNTSPSFPNKNNNTASAYNTRNYNAQDSQRPAATPLWETSSPRYIIQKQKTSPVLIIVIIALVLVVGVLVGMFFVMNRKDKKESSKSNSSVSEVEETTAEITEAPTESEPQTTTAEKTTAAETTTEATTTEQPEKETKTLTTYPESDISKYPQYIKAAENDRDSGLADYFALVDINADNIPELFLTDMDGRIYAIYTAVGNDYAELQRVGGTGRDWITLYNDGCISHGSSFGNDGGYTDYEYTGGKELKEIKTYSLNEYNDIPTSHDGEANISVSSLDNYITKPTENNVNDYTVYDTSAATADFYFNANQFGYGGTVVTENDPLNLRVAPSSNSEVIIQMPQGADVGIFGYNNDWYYVCYTESGITYYGYASRNFIADSGI